MITCNVKKVSGVLVRRKGVHLSSMMRHKLWIGKIILAYERSPVQNHEQVCGYIFIT